MNRDLRNELSSAFIGFGLGVLLVGCLWTFYDFGFGAMRVFCQQGH